MKELSIEEKAKAYDGVLERAKKVLLDCTPEEQKVVEYITPELKESKDDKIRKALFTYFSKFKPDDMWDDDFSCGDIVAWFEKQGDIIENNMLLPFKEYDNLMDSINKKKKEGYEAGYKQGLIDSKNDQHVQPKFKVGDTIRVKNSLAEYVITDIYGGCYHGKGWSLDIISADRSGDYELVEQKPTDKVEPKFKVGDWIISDKAHENYRICKITNVENGNYTIESIDGYKGYNTFETFEKSYRLWTINDAKDGDVLSYVTGEEDLWIMIYWSLYEPYDGHVHYHALLVNDNFADKGTCCICIDYLKPATKEQCDLLFQKMKEAGYEWNAEKKELKKFQRMISAEAKEALYDKPLDIEIPFGRDSELIEETIFIPEGCYAVIEGNKVIIRKGENPVWSEEDEKMLNDILMCGERHCYLDAGNIAWLKSLKDRMLPQNKWKESLATADLENSLCDIQDGFSDTSYEYRILGEAIEFIRCTESKPQWKPSDEQIKGIEYAITTLRFQLNVGDKRLNSLYEDLKKLR